MGTESAAAQRMKMSESADPLTSTFFSDPSGMPNYIADWYARIGAADGWRWLYRMSPAWDSDRNAVVGEFEWTWTGPEPVSESDYVEPYPYP